MQAYFDVVYYTGSVQLAREQLETSTAELKKSHKLLELGLRSAADVAEVESQQASGRLPPDEAGEQPRAGPHRTGRSDELPADRPLEIDTAVPIETPAGAAPYDEVVSYALENHPKALSADYGVRRSRLQFSVARGSLYPSLYVGGGYSTNFFMSLDNRTLYASFPNQFRDNRGFYVSAQLSIPIFGGLARRTSVNRARNNWHIAEQQRMETLRALESEVAQAYQQMLGYGRSSSGLEEERRRAAGLRRRCGQSTPGSRLGARPADGGRQAA